MAAYRFSTNVFSDQNGINIDINRPDPDTIFLVTVYEVRSKRYHLKQNSKMVF